MLRKIFKKILKFINMKILELYERKCCFDQRNQLFKDSKLDKTATNEAQMMTRKQHHLAQLIIIERAEREEIKARNINKEN